MGVAGSLVADPIRGERPGEITPPLLSSLAEVLSLGIWVCLGIASSLRGVASAGDWPRPSDEIAESTCSDWDSLLGVGVVCCRAGGVASGSTLLCSEGRQNYHVQ